MFLLNDKGVSTCQRWQGESVVDLVWATQETIARVTHCEVAQGKESLSDHRYIQIRLHLPNQNPSTRRPRRRARTSRSLEDGSHPQLRKWATRKLDEEKMITVIYAVSWAMEAYTANLSNADLAATRFQRKLREICDISMPRYHYSRKKNTYWWSNELEELRTSCLKARRVLQRSRRRKLQPPQQKERLSTTYSQATANLRVAIKQAKTKAWDELISTLDKDPWGRPYRIVLGKIKPRTLPYTISLPARGIKEHSRHLLSIKLREPRIQQTPARAHSRNLSPVDNRG